MEGSGTGDRRFYHADHQGSIIALSNSSGGVLVHEGSMLRADLASKDQPKSINPQPHALIANADTTLMEQILQIAQRK